MIDSTFRRGAFLVLLIVAAWPVSARTQETKDPEAALTATAAAEEALRRNPDLAAAYASIEAARGRLVQLGLWPNPELALSARSDFAFRDEGERAFGFDFEQRFPIAGRLARAQDLGRVDVALALAEARDFERTLIGEVGRTYYRVRALDASIASRQAVSRTARELAESSARRFRAAEVSEADTSLLEIEADRFEQEQRLLELERTAAGVRLNQLLNRPASAAVVLSGGLDARALDAPRAISAEPLQRRPDLARARLEADRAQAEMRLARAEAWEDWTLGAGYETDRQVFDEPESDPIGVKKDSFVGLSVRVPLPIWNRNQGRIAEAQGLERRARSRLAALERAVEAEVQTARLRVEELTRVAEQYDAALLPRSRRTVGLLQKGYRQGLVPITALVQGQQQLADTELRRAQTLGELRQAEIELETAAAASPLLGRPGSGQEVRP